MASGRFYLPTQAEWNELVEDMAWAHEQRASRKSSTYGDLHPDWCLHVLTCVQCAWAYYRLPAGVGRFCKDGKLLVP